MGEMQPCLMQGELLLGLDVIVYFHLNVFLSPEHLPNGAA